MQEEGGREGVGKDPKEQACVNAFAIFIFSAQFNSGMNQCVTNQNTKVHLKKFIYTFILTLQ